MIDIAALILILTAMAVVLIPKDKLRGMLSW